jgi:hypothetical protein
MPATKKHRVPFKDEASLVKFSLEVLTKAGMTIEQVERLRNRRATGEMFNPETVGMRRFATAELLAANLSNDQIAKVFKQSKETVNADRQQIKQVYVDNILATADQWRARLLDEQDKLKAKALESFEASKSKTVRRVQENANGSTVTEEEHCSAGESSFLTVAKGCLEQQAKLLGLYESKPRSNNDDNYKSFLNTLSKEVKKINQAEANASDRAVAIDASAEAEFDDNGEPTGNSRPMLPAEWKPGDD